MGSFGNKLRILRKQRGLSQAQVSEALGYSNLSYVSDAERGKFIPQPDKLAKWADALGMPYSEMEDLLLEHRLEELGLEDPAFTIMFKEVPKLNNEEKRALINAYEKVVKIKEARLAKEAREKKKK